MKMDEEVFSDSVHLFRIVQRRKFVKDEKKAVYFG